MTAKLDRDDWDVKVRPYWMPLFAHAAAFLTGHVVGVAGRRSRPRFRWTATTSSVTSWSTSTTMSWTPTGSSGMDSRAVPGCRGDAVGVSLSGADKPMRLSGFGIPHGFALVPRAALLTSACDAKPGFALVQWASEKAPPTAGPSDEPRRSVKRLEAHSYW